MPSRRVFLGLINTFFFFLLLHPPPPLRKCVLGGFCFDQSSRCLLGETVTHGCALSAYSLETLCLALSPHSEERRAHVHTSACTQSCRRTKQQVATYQLDKSKLAKSTAARWTNAGPKEKWRSVSRSFCFFSFFLLFFNFSTLVCGVHAGKTNLTTVQTKSRLPASLGQTRHMVDVAHDRGVNWWELAHWVDGKTADSLEELLFDCSLHLSLFISSISNSN